MQSVQFRQTDRSFGDGTREDKIMAGSRFLLSISGLPIRFGGISGSVSYDPLPEDDIDLFIITRKNRLWTTILMAFVRRRLSGDPDICLSLFMSEDYALRFFRKQSDPLITEDSVRAVPVIGEDYYRCLLSQSPYIVRSHPDFTHSNGVPASMKLPASPVETISFILGACYLKMKGMIVNRRLRKQGREDETFRTVVSPGCMILDSLKYSRLRRNAEGERL